MAKIVCSFCSSIAVWLYEPHGCKWGYCDKHIQRGCSCQVVNGKNLTDDNGMELPCCEYSYHENGFEAEENGAVPHFMVEIKKPPP